jgi:NarL family two-component system response regulator LiaR
MRKTIILYALSLAVLVFLLKVLEYKLFIRDLPVTYYVGIIALIFTVVGIWSGSKLIRPKTIYVQSPVTPTAPIDPGEKLKLLGISRREFEVLELMAKGFSNQEIADKLFISLNTVKTHSSNLFIKLDVKRRTQAIEKAKTEGLLR